MFFFVVLHSNRIKYNKNTNIAAIIYYGSAKYGIQRAERLRCGQVSRPQKCQPHRRSLYVRKTFLEVISTYVSTFLCLKLLILAILSFQKQKKEKKELI